jgi:hypothetical protein
MTNDRAFRGSATTAPHLALVSTSVDDPAIRTWQRHPADISRETLLQHAQAKLDRLMELPEGWDGHRATHPTPLAAMVVNGILEYLLFDDCATPQLAPRPDGGIEVEWLVGGVGVNVGVSPTGMAFVTVDDDQGNELVDGSFDFWAADYLLLDQARNYLEKLSHEVEHRVSAG